MWCAFRFPPDAPRQSVDVLLSLCVFHRPAYTKFVADGSLEDVTHKRQAQFQAVLAAYERAFEAVPWFRHRVVVRVYFDASLATYATPEGARPWPATLARLHAHPGFQMVEFRADGARFREGAGHRGLLGTLVRFHAACEDAPPPAARVVAVVDADSFYTRDWWARQFAFAAGTPDVDVLGFTSPFELMFHAAAEVARPEDVARLKPTLKAGFTSFRKRFPAGFFDAIAADLERRRPHLRALDALRPAVYPDSRHGEARLFEEFAYGIDELLLNAWLTESAMRVGTVDLRRAGGPAYFFERLLAFLRWNAGVGGRSETCKRLAAAVGAKDGDLVAHVERVAATADLAAAAPWATHMALWTQAQVDGRILAVLANAAALAKNKRRLPAASAFLVDSDANGSERIVQDMAAWAV